MGKEPFVFKCAVSLKGQQRGKEVVPHPLDKVSLTKEGEYQCSRDTTPPGLSHSTEQYLVG